MDGVVARCTPLTHSATSSSASWLKCGAVRTTKDEDGKTAVEFEPGSHDAGVRRSRGSPSLALALLRTFIGYFAFSGLLMLGYGLIAFVNPFLLR